MGRTRTNKIVVFEGKPEHVGELFEIHVQQANGFSLYGTPVVQTSSPASRMIYHLSLQTAGLIAGLFLLLVSAAGTDQARICLAASPSACLVPASPASSF